MKKESSKDVSEQKLIEIVGAEKFHGSVGGVGSLRYDASMNVIDRMQRSGLNPPRQVAGLSSLPTNKIPVFLVASTSLSGGVIPIQGGIIIEPLPNESYSESA